MYIDYIMNDYPTVPVADPVAGWCGAEGPLNQAKRCSDESGSLETVCQSDASQDPLHQQHHMQKYRKYPRPD